MLKRFFRKHKIDGTAKALFLRAIALCVTRIEFEDIHKIFTCIILISSNRKDTKQTISAKNFLYMFVSKELVGKMHVDIPVYFEKAWTTKIIDGLKSIKMKETAIDNIHYFPDLVTYIKYIGRLVYLWSNIIPFKAGSKKLIASSNIVESSFSVLKNNVSSKKIHTCDAFLEFLKNTIIGEMSHLKGNLNQNKSMKFK